MLCEMVTHDGQPISRTPTADEDRPHIAAWERGLARRQGLRDARAQWLGYRDEADFADRAIEANARHRRLPHRLREHLRVIYFGIDR